MQFFYKLINGASLRLSAKLIHKPKEFNTINRRYHEWINNSLICDTYEQILNEYKSIHISNEMYIDSTDLMNANCSKKHTGKSLKLNKQAIKLSYICDQNKVPISPYQLDKPNVHDSKAGFEVIIQTNINNDNPIFLAGDKGYILDDETKNSLKKSMGFRLINPKKVYRERKYKTKNYNRKIKRIRHSKQMKCTLKNRIYVEHSNNMIHRSFKALDKIYDRKIESLKGFIDLAFSVMTIMKL